VATKPVAANTMGPVRLGFVAPIEKPPDLLELSMPSSLEAHKAMQSLPFQTMDCRPWQDRSDLGAVSLNACSLKAPAVIGHVRHLLFLLPDRTTARIADRHC